MHLLWHPRATDAVLPRHDLWQLSLKGDVEHMQVSNHATDWFGSNQLTWYRFSQDLTTNIYPGASAPACHC